LRVILGTLVSVVATIHGGCSAGASPIAAIYVHYAKAPAVAQHPQHKTTRVAHSNNGGAATATDAPPLTGDAVNDDDHFVKPFSKEWYQRQEEDNERLKKALTICRSC
jgi:hypothetical protein